MVRSILTSACLAVVLAGGSEARAQDVGARALMQADADGDGAISRQELDAVGMKRFRQLDRDGDGLISVQEYLGQDDRMFVRLDRNRDGLIQAQELPRRRKAGPG